MSHTGSSSGAAGMFLAGPGAPGLPPVPTALAVTVSPRRARQGDRVTVSFAAPETPTPSPLAAVTDSHGAVALAFAVPLAASPDVFSWSFRLPATVPLDTFTVTVSFAALASGTQYQGSQTFDLVAGGDYGGRVISLAGHDRPEGTHVIAHLDTGRLVQGSNPHL